MTVYVDDMYLYPMGEFRHPTTGRLMKMSHLIADTDDELHTTAALIGVARRWHQAPPKHDSHYDIAKNKRELAIKAFGVTPITLRQCSFMCLRRRMTDQLGRPEEAQAWRETLSVRREDLEREIGIA